MSQEPSPSRTDRIFHWLEERIFPVLVTLSEVRALRAVRDAVYASFPAILVGFVLVFAFLNIHEPLRARGFEAFRGGLSFLAVTVSFTLGWRLGKLWRLGTISSSFLAFLLFYLTFPRFDWHLRGLHELFSYLSQGGLFVAILLSILFLKFADLLHRRIFLLTYPDPPARWLAKGFAFTILGLAMLILAQLGIVVHVLVFQVFTPLMYAGDSLPWVLLIVTLMSFMWLIGLHGAGIIGAIVMPLYLVMINENFNAHAAGLPLSYIVTPPFFTLCFIGGSGGTLPLLFYMWRSPSARLRKLARAALLPSLGNINEILIFGIPLVMNPILAPPFVLGPVLLCLVNYLAFAVGLVERIFILLPFFLPSPLLAYLATGADWRAPILVLVDFLFLAIFYRPFYRVYERQVIAEESARQKPVGATPDPADPVVLSVKREIASRRDGIPDPPSRRDGIPDPP